MKIFVINLDRSPDRLQHITQQFSKAGYCFHRVVGIDGNLLSDQEYEYLISVTNWPLKLTKREVGCFLSHRECLKKIMEGDDPYAAVFEDDILLSPNAVLFLNNWDWIPSGTDIVKLDTAKIKCLLGRSIKKLSNGYQLAPLLSKHYCTAGYIISRACAKTLYELTQFAIAPIDEIYFNPDCGVMHMLKIQQMYPAIVVQADLQSTIRNLKEAEVSSMVMKREKRSFKQKLLRECARFKKRYLCPLKLVFVDGYQWRKILFK